MIGFDRTHLEDEKNLDWMVHFFLYDYKFERIWKEPDRDIERLRRYRAVLTPDFSMYLEMNPTIQLYNTFRNRWCGAYFQSKGLRVIPTVNWGDESTFDFCFLGIPKGSTVAVSTYMVSEHDNRCDQKDFFLKGYNEMLRRIESERIICYNTPFPEMEGNIVFVDYELSSWKHQGSFEITPQLSPYAKHISGRLPLPENCGIIIKRGYVMNDRVEKGSGSAYGGEWKPSKPEDYRLLGKPGEIKISYAKDGSKIETKIGEDGRAVAERHHTSSPNPKYHSNPHDHIINWEFPRYGMPNFVKPHINYWPEEYPNGAPEFKSFIRGEKVSSVYNTEEDNRFKTISEFKECIIRGGEPVFMWEGLEYGVCFVDDGYCIARTDGSYEKICSTPDDVLTYTLGAVSLREVITKVTVISRAI